jgi:hypothetical protein
MIHGLITAGEGASAHVKDLDDVPANTTLVYFSIFSHFISSSDHPERLELKSLQVSAARRRLTGPPRFIEFDCQCPIVNAQS